LFPYILFEKYIYLLALETANPENHYCANCIGTLSFPMFIFCSFTSVQASQDFRRLSPDQFTPSDATAAWIGKAIHNVIVAEL